MLMFLMAIPLLVVGGLTLSALVSSMKDYYYMRNIEESLADGIDVANLVSSLNYERGECSPHKTLLFYLLTELLMFLGQWYSSSEGN